MDLATHWVPQNRIVRILYRSEFGSQDGFDQIVKGVEISGLTIKAQRKKAGVLRRRPDKGAVSRVLRKDRRERIHDDGNFFFSELSGNAPFEVHFIVR